MEERKLHFNNQLICEFYASDGERTHHPVGSQGSLDIASQHIGGVMPVVRDTGQPSVDGQQNQEKLQRRPQQSSPSPCQPRLQVKLGNSRNKKTQISEEPKLFYFFYFIMDESPVSSSKESEEIRLEFVMSQVITPLPVEPHPWLLKKQYGAM